MSIRLRFEDAYDDELLEEKLTLFMDEVGASDIEVIAIDEV